MADPLDLWILEDDIALCSLIAEQCQRQHWQLQAFHHPRSLDAALAERSPDLLLLDQMLPEKCGTDILASLRNCNHRFPVLMISAMAAPSDRVLGLDRPGIGSRRLHQQAISIQGITAANSKFD